MTSLKAGDPAPSFELLDDTGKLVRLKDFAGRKVVLYFYPRDDTPGCTVEANGFQTVLAEVQGKNALVLGVSPDDVESHRRFKAKYGLTFPLLADPDHRVAEAYGVWGLQRFGGREYEGISRTTFVIDANGRIETVFENVIPEGHCDLVVAKL